jgi:predicted DNA-binding protein
METPDKEPVVRLTVDLPESMHRRLSILCARTGKKKAEVIRMLLNEVLIDVSE